MKNIGIIGGGVAGYLSALAFKRFFPSANVTIIESDRIPIIGVGEATTPPLVDFLHRVLNLDIQEFYKQVQPTHKMGIRFEWGLQAPYHFNYPFEPQDIYLASSFNNDPTLSCLQSLLMNENKSIIFKQNGLYKPIQSIAKRGNYAYHLDNKKFVAYLKSKSNERGVFLILDTIDQVQLSPSGDRINHLNLESGKKVSFDFYVDCTGFSSLLLGKSLKVNFIDFSGSLFTDSALTASIAANNQLPSFTRAVTMNHGWKWELPLRESIHIGYVFSSAFANADEIEQELRLTHPEIEQTRLLKFQSGRHEKSLKGNVLAIGNSFGFVEPLESTGLHMIVSSLNAFNDLFSGIDFSSLNVNRYNSILNDKWDQLRWFLALHYKFNSRLSTPFWKENKEKVDVSGYSELIDLMRKDGPLRQDKHMKDSSIRKLIENSIIRYSGLDTFLIGQGQFPKQPNTDFLNSKKGEFLAKNKIWQDLSKMALPHREALLAIENQPELISFTQKSTYV